MSTNQIACCVAGDPDIAATTSHNPYLGRLRHLIHVYMLLQAAAISVWRRVCLYRPGRINVLHYIADCFLFSQINCFDVLLNLTLFSTTQTDTYAAVFVPNFYVT